MPKSVSQKSLQNCLWDVEPTFCHIQFYMFPSSHLQCWTPGDPRKLCANTRIADRNYHSCSQKLLQPFLYRKYTGLGSGLHYFVVYWLQLWGGALRIPPMRKNTRERDATLTGY